VKDLIVGKLFEHGICGGMIGVITKVIDDDNVEITFSTNGNINGNIIKMNAQKITINFENQWYTCLEVSIPTAECIFLDNSQDPRCDIAICDSNN
ncbi:334_t:CDS:1, partial [Entrophospora sp. SA101]